jgi:hypothetical protein
MRPYLKKKKNLHTHTHTHKRLVEWLKVWALSLNPSTTKKKCSEWLGLVVYGCNPSTQEAEAGESRIQSQRGLHTVRPCLKKRKSIESSL